MSYETAFKEIIGHEGGYTDDPEDDGNWTGGAQGVGELKGTKYGISAAAYPQLNIKALTLDDAKVIYFQDYWKRVRCDELPPAVAFTMFDCAVNQGILRAIRCMQRALGVKDDGVFGPQTLAKAKAHKNKPDLIAKFMAERILEYVQAKRWPRFKGGWSLRAFRVAMTAAKM